MIASGLYFVRSEYTHAWTKGTAYYLEKTGTEHYYESSVLVYLGLVCRNLMEHDFFVDMSKIMAMRVIGSRRQCHKTVTCNVQSICDEDHSLVHGTTKTWAV